MTLLRRFAQATLIALVAVAAPLAAVGVPQAALAQADLRNTFPGRRIGGGTRGECSARLIAHLVPNTSVFAPGASATIGLLEGPTAQPRPLQLSFRPLSSAGTAAKAQASTTTRDLPAAPMGVVLIKVAPIKIATIWESAYRCDESGAKASADGLDFVQTASPPAVSLLVSDAQRDDKAIEAALKQLRAQCGNTVATAELVKSFGVADVITAEWPQQLPVRCP